MQKNDVSSDFIMELFCEKYLNNKRYFDSEVVDYKIEDLLYFVSVSYDKLYWGKRAVSQVFLEKINKQFDLLHKTINQNIITGNRARKYYQQPFAYVSIDVAASKADKNMSEDRIYERPHHHGLFLLHPETKKWWDEINNLEYWKVYCRRSSSISNIDFRQIDDLSNVTKVIDYSRKYSRKQLWNIAFGDRIDNFYPDIYDGKLAKAIFGKSFPSMQEKMEACDA